MILNRLGQKSVMNSRKAKLLHVLLIITGILNAFSAGIEQVDDTDLVHLLTGEDNVIALFTKANCPKCDELEEVIENVQNELKETLGAVVCKVHNSNLVGIYDPSREPSLIYFRRGIPLLFYGNVNADEIVQTFSDNREPVVKELSDRNFEHLTQAATGATTGDWFVFFYSADCVFCQRLYAVWETVGATLKRRLNVARINRLEAGISTAKRFGITESPEFILLRLGKIYRYKLKEYEPKNFIEFAESGYSKKINPEKVPPVANSTFQFLFNKLQFDFNNIPLLLVGAIVLTIIILIGLTIKCMLNKKSTKAENKQKLKKAK